MHISLHNLLPVAAKVYGLHSYPGNPDEFIPLGPGETREVQFDAGEPGTYVYWASTTGGAIDDPVRRQGGETMLEGAFVVDAPGETQPDRIFVIETWEVHDLPKEIILVAINGKAWPATEHLTYKTDEPVRWRIINTTRAPHAMHLHGFFFTVTGVGDRSHFTQYTEAQRRLAVTEGIDSGHSFEMTWTPERVGNWLFHCHMNLHISASPALHPAGAKSSAHSAEGDPAEGDRSAGMGGLVLGVTVVPGSHAHAAPVETKAPRKLQLTVAENPAKIPLYKLELNDPAAAPHKDDERKEPALMGPPIILTRGEPVEIEIKNQSTAPTAIHWHGIELESYYDGVAGWSGSGQQVTPPIAPGGSFVAHFAPPRAGTFIYHTHWHDTSQLDNGLYGPLIVLNPGEKLDPDTDRTFLFSVGIYPPLGFMMLINGQPGPNPMPLHTGQRYRFRLINITDEGSDLRVRLLNKEQPVSWKMIAKDGADLPAAQVVTSAAEMTLPVGSTADVEVTLEKEGLMGLQISSEVLLGVAMYPIIAVSK
jgi:FtsP/CotA-like multicopper oxidase with cupredoxin domain